jgi:urea transport system permease protein
MLFRSSLLSRLAIPALCILSAVSAGAETAREIINKAILTEDAEEQEKIVSSLAGLASPEIPELFAAWKESTIYIYELPQSAAEDAPKERVAIVLTGKPDGDGKQPAIRLENQQPLKDYKGQPVLLVAGDLTSADTDSNLRRAMKVVLDLAALNDPNPVLRQRAVSTLAMDQNTALLPALNARAAIESNSRVHAALRETISIISLKSEDSAVQAAAARELGELGSFASKDSLSALLKEVSEDSPVAQACTKALADIESHKKWVNFYGTLFRGASAGSVLLVAAIGLAITFGLMGVINMAHGELIAVGAYATYFVQNIFGPGLAKFGIRGLGLTGAAYDSYFIVALPIAFLSAALVGIALERTVIKHLYRRPLESLLATWGVSLILQQLFRLVIGSNNVQVDSPAWLSGNWTIHDVQFGWNRVFVIGFSAAIIFGVWLLLTRTPLGLLIRAVMQNRQMAACMGVRTERVNMLTFGLGSGLAGLAGAFFSQIGNVGPGLGQDHIVSAFMTVVVGGVGSLAGTVTSALGIGTATESAQQLLGDPVLGKVSILAIVILFMMWKPAGIFVTKSRSLEG